MGSPLTKVRRWRGSASRLVVASGLLLALNPGAAFAADLVAPLGLRWGASPTEVGTQLRKTHQVMSLEPAPDSEPMVVEQRYSGEFLGMACDNIRPIFYGGQLFSVSAYYAPTPTRPASYTWEILVSQLERQYGKPSHRTKPLPLLSLNAVLHILPVEANRGKLMELYNAADNQRHLGAYLLMDLQVQTGAWAPEAKWIFANGATLKVAMRASGKTEYGLVGLKTVVIMSRHEQLK